ncbi:SIS domain-containing protein [Bacillus sp. JJ1562]|uniref:SIS domain-containing protein n=1 Tax=Bacillus sp. JJ1562 TaxID=3122960 RepID=UPI003002836F
MNKLDYDNHLHRQCMSIIDLCDSQIDGVYSGLENISESVLKQARNLTFTGCGDSYMACIAALPVFQKYTGAFASIIKVERAIDATRYMPIDQQFPEDTMLVAVSASGSPARIFEALKRANSHGYMSLAVSNNTESRAVQEAQNSLIVNTPSFPNANPGLRNYYASVVALMMLAAKMGEVKGISKKGTLDRLTEAIKEYTKSYSPVLESIDKQMFELAKTWKDFEGFNFIGDDTELATASFCSAKVIEVSGIISSVEDSENWCHVNTFIRNPEKIGTIIFADKLANNKSRIIETIKQAKGMNRPILVITNGTKEDFDIPEEVNVCSIPQAPSGYEFLSPVMNYLPGAILASYISHLLKEPYFRGDGIWAQEGVGTIKNSEIEII